MPSRSYLEGSHKSGKVDNNGINESYMYESKRDDGTSTFESLDSQDRKGRLSDAYAANFSTQK